MRRVVDLYSRRPSSTPKNCVGGKLRQMDGSEVDKSQVTYIPVTEDSYVPSFPHVSGEASQPHDWRRTRPVGVSG